MKRHISQQIALIVVSVSILFAIVPVQAAPWAETTFNYALNIGDYQIYNLQILY